MNVDKVFIIYMVKMDIVMLKGKLLEYIIKLSIFKIMFVNLCLYYMV